QQAWRRLRKNKGAMAGLIIIFISVLTGIFAYYLGTDSTPNADRQIVEIQARKPGFEQMLLKVPKQKQIEKTSVVEKLLFGEEDEFLLIPINSYTETGDSVFVQKYIDEGLQELQ